MGGNMDILISNASKDPIYEQIRSQIVALIVKGDLKEGDMLPSMRELAKSLRISVITTKRAYEELQKDGFINTYPGKGSFVALQNKELIREEAYIKIEGKLEEINDIASMANIKKEEIKEIVDLIMED